MHTPDRLLEGYTTLITGGSRGIGKEIGLEFTRNGAKTTYFVSRGDKPETEAEVLQTVEDIKTLGASALWIKTDLSTVEGIEAVLSRVQTDKARINVLVNNAGATFTTIAQMNTPELLDASFRLNLRAPTLLTTKLKERGLYAPRAKVIFMASILGSEPNIGSINYGIMKAGVILAAKILAMEWGPEGMSVNSISPGFIPTELTKKEVPEEILPVLKDLTPKSKRLGTVEDIAKAALFLASGMSDFVNGVDLPVDGNLRGMAGSAFILHDAGYRKLNRMQKKQLGIK